MFGVTVLLGQGTKKTHHNNGGSGIGSGRALDAGRGRGGGVMGWRWWWTMMAVVVDKDGGVVCGDGFPPLSTPFLCSLKRD